jgi:hypothetical protein
MSGYAFAVGACIALVVFLVVLLRTRRLREKYAIAWIIVGLGICVLGAFPSTVQALAKAVGVQTPSNLLFALALFVLLLVCIQLSVEITTLEEETRTLAEELALLRFDFERSKAPGQMSDPGRAVGAGEPPVTGATIDH